MRAKILAIALLLLAALAYAQSNDNVTNLNVSSIVIEKAKQVATPLISGFEAALGVLFWLIVGLGLLYRYGDYLSHRSIDRFFAQGPLYGLVDHVKSIIMALVGIYIVAFIIGGTISAAGAGDPTWAIIRMFIRSLTLGYNVFNI